MIQGRLTGEWQPAGLRDDRGAGGWPLAPVRVGGAVFDAAAAAGQPGIWVALDVGKELPVVRVDDQGFAVALDRCPGPAQCVLVVPHDLDTGDVGRNLVE